MHFKNEELNPEFEATLFKFPNEFQKLLGNYFAEMRKRGVVREKPETLAMIFLATNLGLFITALVLNKLTYESDIQACISSSVAIFAKGITC